MSAEWQAVSSIQLQSHINPPQARDSSLCQIISKMRLNARVHLQFFYPPPLPPCSNSLRRHNSKSKECFGFAPLITLNMFHSSASVIEML